MTKLRDKARLERFLRKQADLQLYALGDLDDFFWPHTSWYAAEQSGEIRAIALLYSASRPPVLLALDGREPDTLRDLVTALHGELPDRFYAHLSPGIEDALAGRYRLESHGEHYRMMLRHPERIRGRKFPGVFTLTPDDTEELRRFYDDSYPGHWFDSRMLETGHYVGIRVEGRLVCVSGVHVYSPTLRVAALGNIATAPALRGRGYATAATAALCAKLLASVDQIGLNVKADNGAAIACYAKLGLEVAASYGEYSAGLAGG